MNRKILIGLSFITLLIIGMSVFLLSGESTSQTVEASTNVTAEILQTPHFDFGDIPISGGDVRKTFTIKNTGSESLLLSNVKTSCHCTEATMTIGEKTSEYFGMSGFSSWVGEVTPGEEATLTIIFDPAFHGPQGTGPVTRYVSVETNEKGNEKLMFTLTGTVTE